MFGLVTYHREGHAPEAGMTMNGRVYPLAGLASVDAAGSPEILSGDISIMGLLRHWQAAVAYLDHLCAIAARDAAPSFALAETRLDAPFMPTGLFCCSANYGCHLSEMTQGRRTTIDKATTRPFFFLKSPAHCVIGPNEPILKHPHVERLDWEAELAVVIGDYAADLSPDEAMSVIAGYSIINDVSARDRFARPDWPDWKDWLGHKSGDASAPFGPLFVPANQVADPYRLGIRLWVNDVLQQDGSTATMIFSLAEQVAFLSEYVTLRPGDVIATGTPAGVGAARGIFLAEGDRLRVEIDGLGAQENIVRLRTRKTNQGATA